MSRTAINRHPYIIKADVSAVKHPGAVAPQRDWQAFTIVRRGLMALGCDPVARGSRVYVAVEQWRSNIGSLLVP